MKPHSSTKTLMVGLVMSLTATTAWAKSADLLWENRGQSAPFGRAYAIGGEGNVVVATGETCSALSFATCDWFVRAHDAKTGATLWEDRLGGGGLSDTAQTIAVDAGGVFAAGWVRTAAQGYDFVVRAYALKSGQLLWTRRVDRRGRNERAFAVVAQEGRVFVAGNIGRDFALLVIDPRTGNTLWESADAGVLGTANGVVVHGDRVFVVGTISSGTPSGLSLLVRAYDARTGALLWEDRAADVLATLTGVNVDGLAVNGNLLFVGAGARNFDSINVGVDFMVRAYDVQTGALVWVDQLHRQDGGSPAALSLGAGRLFVWGWDCDETVFNCHGDVRAYDSQTGTLQWESRFTGPGGDIILPIPTAAFEAEGNQVFVGTGLLNLQGRYEWTVRSYDATDGTLRWENRIDDAGTVNVPFGLKALDGRLYVAGQAEGSDDSDAFTIRAYDV